LSQPNATELSALLDELLTMLAQLDAAQVDSQRYREILDRIRSETAAAEQPFATHDPEPNGSL